MIPIIEGLINAEKEAEKIIADARERVQTERSELESREQSILQEARRSADARLQQSVNEARLEAEARYSTAVLKAKAEADQFIGGSRAELAATVDAVVTEICRSQLERA